MDAYTKPESVMIRVESCMYIYYLESNLERRIMALSIKTDEADRLARQLAALTGESMTEAVTQSLKERLARLKGTANKDGTLPDQVQAFAASIAHKYDLSRPVTQDEWDDACGDTPQTRGF